MSLQLLVDGEGATAATLNRSVLAMLTQSGYTTDGSDFAGFAKAVHTHTVAQITDLQAITTAATPGTVALRDGSGNLSAVGILSATVATTGNATIGGTITSTAVGGAILSAPNPTTREVFGLFANTFGNMLWGIEGSAGGAIIAGTAPNAVVIGTVSPKPIQFLNAGLLRVAIDASGNLIAGADSTYDIGLSGASRFRNLFLAGSAAVGGTLTQTGDIRLGAASALLGTNDVNGLRFGIFGVGYFGTLSQAGNWTFGGNVQTTLDNAYDLGAAGNFRFRDLFLSRNALIGASLNVGGGYSTSFAEIFTVLGNASIRQTAAADASFIIHAPAGQNRNLVLRSGLSTRWTVGADNSAEAGADAGSAFQISAFSDAAAFIDQPLKIARAAGGAITLARPILASGSTETRISYTNTSGPNSWATAVGGGAQLAIGYFGISTSSVYTAATSALVLSTSGDVLIGNATNGGRIMPFGTGKALVALGTLSSQSGAVVSLQNSGGFLTATGGVVVFLDLSTSNTFAPTSGTATYTGINLAPVINQTGGANGITRGLYINPTLTAPADWRALEIGSTTGIAIKTNGGSHILGGNVTALTDNGFDIGASGANRFRDLFLARNATIGNILTVTSGVSIVGGGITVSAGGANITGTITLTGAVSTGGVTTIGSTLMASTDNSFDIGQAASNRFRDLNLARNIIAGGTNIAVGPSAIFGALSGLSVSAAAGTQRGVELQTAGVARWRIMADTTGETGTDAGSKLRISAIGDSGSFIDDPISIVRAATGQISFSRSATLQAASAFFNVTSPSGPASTTWSAVSGSAVQLIASSGGSGRWVLNLKDGSAETGSNAGSNFSLSARDDAGVQIDNVISITRAATGGIQITRTLIAAFDNTQDIGLPSANRFRDLNLARNATIGGTGQFGGTVTLTAGSVVAQAGSLIAGSNTVAGGVQVNGAASSPRNYVWKSAGVSVWEFLVNGTESGANAGATLSFVAHDDTGSTIDTALSIVRAAGGVMTLARPVNHSKTIAVGGSNPLTYKGLFLGVALTGSTDQRAVDAQPICDVGATVNGIGYYSQPATAAAAFTLASAFGFYAADWTLGAGSAITTQYGVYVASQTKGATNYAIFTNTGQVSIGDQLVVRANGLSVTGASTFSGGIVQQGASALRTAHNIVTTTTGNITHIGLAVSAPADTTATGNVISIAATATLQANLATQTAFGLSVGNMSLAAGASATTQYGVYINPLSGATSNYAVYVAGANLSFFGGPLGVNGVTPATQYGINLGGALSGATDQRAFNAAPTYGSGATTAGITYNSSPATAAAAFTLAAAYHFAVNDIGKGAGSTITAQYGLYVASLANATTNYAIYTNTGTVSLGDRLIAKTDNSYDIGASGANRFRDLFLARNAAIGGTVGVGGLSATQDGLFISSTLTGSTDQRGIWVNATFDSGATAGYGLYVRPSTAATAFTLTNARGIYVGDVIKGAGSTISSQIGILIEAQSQGTTNSALYCNGSNDVVLAGGAAIATTATSGFTFISTCAGQPTGVPVQAAAGRVAMVYDTVNHKFWIYDAGWKGAVLA